MKQIIISEATVVSLPALNRLFTCAVHAHFGYFPSAVRHRVIKEHSVQKLFLATLDSRRVILTAKEGSKIIGYCLGAAPKVGPAQVFWLYVDPEYRGSNIGLTLLSRMLKLLVRRGAQTISIATHDHRRYYERQGFKFIRNTEIDSVKLDILTFEVKK
jgi:ribosomal protein S18 acetylase RimI-like enzyme